VLDAHSRYSLGLIACADQTDATVRAHLTALFRRYGLPDAILADNGAPWGGSGAQGYTAFEVWLLRLGIPLHHGRPYHPQTQGKDERFHRSLDVEVLQLHRFADLPLCQTAFDTWRQVYNTERPHEALELAVPATRYRPSPIVFPERLAEPDYYATDQVRRVHNDGAASFQGRRVKLPQAFAGLPQAFAGLPQAFAGLNVAFRPTASDGVGRVFFARFPVAELDLRDRDRNTVSVRDVSEHPSGLSPV
jgi:hypothetical protein